MTTQMQRPRINIGRWLTAVGWRHAIGAVAVLFAAFPIVYVISASVSAKNTMTDANNLFSTFTWRNFTMLGCDPSGMDQFDAIRCAKVSNFWAWFGNSMAIAGITAIGAMLMGAAAAYAFSRFRFKGRRLGLSALLVIQLFPQMLAFVAILVLMTALGDVVPILGTGSAVGLVAVYLGGALGANTFLMYGFFNTIPQSLDESARIDGATHGQIFWMIVMPLVIPILAVVTLLAFIGTFGEYILASVVLGGGTQAAWTLPMGLYLLVGDSRAPELTLFSAGAALAALPVLLLFLFLQKYIVSGLTGGAVKG